LDIINLVFISILIALTAFFVASEFAIVKVRSSRINQLIEDGRRNAIQAKRVTSDLDEYLSTCQLGITVTALALGWLGESTVARLLNPIIIELNISSTSSHLLAFILSFSLITFIHVVVGELAPKTVAIQKAEEVTLLVAKPLILFNKIMYPFIWILNGSARLLTRAFGFKRTSQHELAHTEEELRIILSESYKSGVINQSEFKYVNKIFTFDDRIAKEIMVPRTEIATLSVDNTIKDFFAILSAEKYTRYPVIDGDKDHVIGMVNSKELFTEMVSSNKHTAETIKRFIRPIIRVIDTVPIHDLLLKMQKERVHMAILMDEYGGTSGLVTVEDILEEIVGDIRDEFDLDEIPEVRQIKEDHYIIDAKVLISEVNDLLGIDMNDDDMDTIGGWMLTENFEAKAGDVLEHEGYCFKIKEIEDHHIRYIEIYKPLQVTVTDGEFQTIEKKRSMAQTEIVS
jgi:CBS domain containing-hemolysin-like protein